MPLVTIKAGFGEHSEPGADGERRRYSVGDPPFEVPAETYKALKYKFDLAPGEALAGDGVSEPESDPPFDVAAHSVKEVLAAVEAGAVTAQAALSAEMVAASPRTSLVGELEKLIEEAGDGVSE